MQSSTQQSLSHILATHFNTDDIVRGERIQSLWSGYGEIVRYRINAKAVVVKIVNPRGQDDHPRGWNTSLSHQRKLDSYHNEHAFYAGFSQQTDGFCRVPEYIASGESNGVLWLVMEDLDASGFHYRCDQAPLALVDQGLTWLAHFHARFLGLSAPDLWQIGTYWHLATRPDELEKMQDGVLKRNAGKIDQRLNQAKYQTLVHGDAKLANFCSQPNLHELAAVDFQYVGRGAGIKDVVYFLGSCLDDDGLHAHAEACLTVYFAHLKNALIQYKIDCDFADIENSWRGLYPFAWADFERFLLGWATEHFKLNRYSEHQTEIALTQL